jgi:hypothetical protein
MASQTQLDILIKAMFDGSGVAQATQAFEGLRSTINTALGAIGITVGLNALNELGNKALEVRKEMAAFTEQILASKDGSAQLVDQLNAQNRALSDATGISEKQIRNIESRLALYGAEKDQILPLTHGIIELAAARRIDADAVSQMVARSLSGEDIVLARLGIRIDKTKTHAEQVKQLLAEMAKIPDIAEKMEQASGGFDHLQLQIERSKVAFGDLINTVRIPFLTAFTGQLGDAKTKIDGLTSSTGTWGKSFAIAAAAAGESLRNILNVIAAVINSLEVLVSFILGHVVAAFIAIGTAAQQGLGKAIDVVATLTRNPMIDVDALAQKAKSSLGLVADQANQTGKAVFDFIDKDFNGALAKLQKNIDDMEKNGKILSPDWIAKVKAQYDALFGTIKSNALAGSGVLDVGGAGKSAADANTLAAAKERLVNAEGDYRLALERVKVLEESGNIEVSHGDQLRRQAAAAYLAELQKVRAELVRLQQAQPQGSKEWEILRREITQTDIQVLKAQQDMSNASFFGKMRSQLVQLKNEWSDLGKQLGGFIVQQAQAFASTFGNAIGSLIFRTGNLKQAILQLGQAFVSQLATMVIQYVLSQTILKGLAAAFGAESSATAATSAAPVNAAWAPAAINASIATFGAAADVGLAQYLVAFAAGLGASQAGGFLGGAKSGGYAGDGGEDEPAGIYHGQEFIFSAPRVRALGRGFLDALHRGMSLTRPSYGAGSGFSGIPGGGGNAVHVYNFTDLREMTRHMASRKGRKIINDVMRGRNFDL